MNILLYVSIVIPFILKMDPTQRPLSELEVAITLIASVLMAVPYYLAYWYGKRQGRLKEIKRRMKEENKLK